MSRGSDLLPDELIDLETFARIEEVLEDFALARWITDAKKETALGLDAAEEYYDSLDKAS